MTDPPPPSATIAPAPGTEATRPLRPSGRPSLLRPLALLLILGAVIALGSRHPGSSSVTPAGRPALAAVVGGVPVPLADYQWQLRVATHAYSGPTAPPNSPTGRTIARLLRDQAVQEAIAETLIDREASIHRLSVSEAALNREVATLVSQAGGTVGLSKQLRTAGMTMNDLRGVARHMILRDRLATLLGDPAWLDHMVGKAQVVYYVGDGAAGPDQVPAVLLGHPAPPFVAVNLAGKAVSPADLQGRAIVLEFWAGSCYDCLDQLNMLAAFSRAHPTVAVVAVDRGETAPTVRAYQATHHLKSLPMWLDSAATAAENYTVTSLPATFFIDGQGILRGYNFGPIADMGSLRNQAGYAERGVNDTAP